jgi:FtsP/CotA-like multicopper oxidase with cupredoxin domain
VRFEPDPALKAAVTHLPRQLATPASLDARSAVARRTFELNPMMGMMAMGLMRGRGSGPAHMMGINGRSFAMDRVDVTARLGSAEVWEISAGGMPMAHPSTSMAQASGF